MIISVPAFANAAAESGEGHSAAIAMTFLWLAILFVLSKVGTLIERIGQPSVLGEIIIGVILGNLGLIGIHWFEPAAVNQYLLFLAEFGVVILLFRIGLESNLKEMSKVGAQAFLVATIGVVIPFIAGTFVVGELFYGDASFSTKLFIGAAMTATSVGITARVFQDLGKLHTKEAKVVLGAAVIDDIMGLLILAVVSSIAASGTLEASTIVILTAKAVGFLVAAIALGQLTAPYIGKFLSMVHTGVGMKLTFAISFALAIAYAASAVGLAPIVGAFAAGLVLDPVHFKAFKSPEYAAKIRKKLESLGDKSEDAVELLHSFDHKHVEDLVDTVGHLFIPLFFVMTGLQVKLDVLFDPKVLAVALAVTAFAFLGKILAGLGTWGGTNRMIVGFGMIPRGEVGLIFANVGMALGVVTDELFSVIIVMVIFSTLLTPPILTFLLKKEDK
ncbi:MAG: cation:proton antiporter, partial [Nanoarchaeota archaeon]|nr:cation:proton antiporter [Nanoarchaeota archaeon]